MEIDNNMVFITCQEELNLAAEIESMEELSSRVFCASNWAGGIFAQDLDSVTTQEYLDSNVRVERWDIL